MSGLDGHSTAVVGAESPRFASAAAPHSTLDGWAGSSTIVGNSHASRQQQQQEIALVSPAAAPAPATTTTTGNTATGYTAVPQSSPPASQQLRVLAPRNTSHLLKSTSSHSLAPPAPATRKRTMLPNQISFSQSTAATPVSPKTGADDALDLPLPTYASHFVYAQALASISAFPGERYSPQPLAFHTSPSVGPAATPGAGVCPPSPLSISRSGICSDLRRLDASYHGSFGSQPDDVIHLILAMLSSTEVCNICAVSRRLRSIASKDRTWVHRCDILRQPEVQALLALSNAHSPKHKQEAEPTLKGSWLRYRHIQIARLEADHHEALLNLRQRRVMCLLHLVDGPFFCVVIGVCLTLGVALTVHHVNDARGGDAPGLEALWPYFLAMAFTLLVITLMCLARADRTRGGRGSPKRRRWHLLAYGGSIPQPPQAAPLHLHMHMQDDHDAAPAAVAVGAGPVAGAGIAMAAEALHHGDGAGVGLLAPAENGANNVANEVHAPDLEAGLVAGAGGANANANANAAPQVLMVAGNVGGGGGGGGGGGLLVGQDPDAGGVVRGCMHHTLGDNTAQLWLSLVLLLLLFLWMTLLALRVCNLIDTDYSKVFVPLWIDFVALLFVGWHPVVRRMRTRARLQTCVSLWCVIVGPLCVFAGLLMYRLSHGPIVGEGLADLGGGLGWLTVQVPLLTLHLYLIGIALVGALEQRSPQPLVAYVCTFGPLGAFQALIGFWLDNGGFSGSKVSFLSVFIPFWIFMGMCLMTFCFTCLFSRSRGVDYGLLIEKRPERQPLLL